TENFLTPSNPESLINNQYYKDFKADFLVEKYKLLEKRKKMEKMNQNPVVDVTKQQNDFQYMCFCNIPTQEKTSLSMKNPRRLYYGCGRPMDDENICKFFIWKNEFNDDSYD